MIRRAHRQRAQRPELSFDRVRPGGVGRGQTQLDTSPRLCADEVHALLDLDPSVDTDVQDIDAVRTILARVPAPPVVSVFGRYSRTSPRRAEVAADCG